MRKILRKRLLSVLMASIMMLSMGKVTFAAENDISYLSQSIETSVTADNEFSIISVSEAETKSTTNETIASFSGQYQGWIDIPFTVTDSSRPVKVMYAIRKTDETVMTTHLGVRMEDANLWFWTKLNLEGSQIQEIGTMKPGDYVLRIKTGSVFDEYIIAGEIYYFG